MKIKFPGSKPNAYEVVSALFNEFTSEEIAILDGEDCYIPHMYSRLLARSKQSKLAWDYDLIKLVMSKLFSNREEIRDPQFQEDLFDFFDSFLHWRK